jgi:hypothetical protein
LYRIPGKTVKNSGRLHFFNFFFRPQFFQGDGSANIGANVPHARGRSRIPAPDVFTTFLFTLEILFVVRIALLPPSAADTIHGREKPFQSASGKPPSGRRSDAGSTDRNGVQPRDPGLPPEGRCPQLYCFNGM